jgi:branched-chain amino acid transport system permease protein
MTRADNRRKAVALRALSPRTVLTVTALAGLLVAMAPLVLDIGDLRLIIEILTVFAFAQTWNLLAGYSGLMSFGQHLFIGIGAYSLFVISNRANLNPFYLLPVAFLFSAAVAAAISPLVFRLRDAYFAIGIWVLAEVARLFVTQNEWLGATSGMSLVATREMDHDWVAYANYWVAVGLALICTIGFYVLLTSRFGLALVAVRDNESAAAASGIDVWWTRFFGFVISSGVCGVAGAAYYMSVFHLDPGAAFDANWVVVMLFIVIIGGVGTIEGPIIGTAIYFLLRGWLAGTGNLYLMLLGAAAVLTMLVSPKGIWGAARRRFGLELFSARRRAD